MTPIFQSHYSLGNILTLDLPDNTTEDGPTSIFSLAQKYNIPKIWLAEDNFGSFFEFYAGCDKLKIDGVFGLKLAVCADVNRKDSDSLNTEHKVTVWALNTQGYHDLIKIWNKAATDFFYYRPRVDENFLTKNWTSNLGMSLPFYSSFMANNTLFFKTCMFDPAKFDAIIELSSNNLYIDNIIYDGWAQSEVFKKLKSHDVKYIYYEKKEDFIVYQTMGCIQNRTTLEEPEDKMTSNEFCMECL